MKTCIANQELASSFSAISNRQKLIHFCHSNCMVCLLTFLSVLLALENLISAASDRLQRNLKSWTSKVVSLHKNSGLKVLPFTSKILSIITLIITLHNYYIINYNGQCMKITRKTLNATFS